MSKQIDERIVEMRFENSKFEKNVSQTMKTIDKLKEKLAFKKASDGFENIQKAADKLSFEHLVESVDNLSDTVRHRTGVIGGIFDALGERIVRVFDNAFGKVQSMINQVTFEPIKTGFSEYELKINSVQTIAANTGVLMRDVMGSMQESGEAMVNTAEDLETAWSVVNGAYGNGAERVEALGDRYDRVQQLVNQIVDGQIKMGDSIESTTDALGAYEYTMEDIEYVLDELNTYADKTIYNYAQMTDSIGKFTVAGVDLYDATSAVQGIANLGAFVGAGEADTSRIMRELAQGLSTGIINLQDWKSLENSAGFAGTVFQDHLVDMADHLYATNEEYRNYIDSIHGSVPSIKALVDSYGKFRNSLTEGAWLNDTVLINTLHEFAGDWGDEMYAALGYTEQEIADLQALGEVAFDAATKSKTFTQMWDAVTEAAQSSWTTTWEYIFGHFYDARNLWTIVGDTLSDIIASNNEARNEVLRIWSETGGRDEFFSGVGHIFNFFKNIAESLKDVWETLFPPMSGEKLTEFSIKFNQFAEALENMDGFYAIAKSLGTVIFTLLKAGTIILGSFLKLLGGIFGNGMDGQILDTIESVALYLELLVTSFIDLDTIGEKSTEFFSTLFDILKSIPIVLLSVAVGIDELSKEFLGFSIIDGIKMIGSLIPIVAEKIKSGFELIKPTLAGIKNFFATVKDSGVVQSVGNFITGILDKIKVDREKGKSIVTIAAGLAQLLLVLHGIKAVKNTGKLSKILGGLPDLVSDMFESIKDAGESITNFGKSGIIITIAKSLLILAVAMGIMALIPSDKLADVASTLIIVMGMIMLLLKVMGGLFDKLPNATMLNAAGAMALLAVSIGILVGSIALLTILDYEAAVKSLVIIGVIMVMIGLLIDKFNHARFRGNIPQVAGAIFIIVQAVSSIGILIAVLSIVAKFNSSGMWEAFKLVTAIFTEIIVLYYVITQLPFTGSGKKLLAIGGLITLLVGAVTAISVLISVLAVVISLDKGNNLLLAAGFVTAVLGIMALMAWAFAGISTIPFNPLGAIALSASLVIVVGALIGFIAALEMVIAIQNAVGYDNMGKHLLTFFGIIGTMILIMGMLRSVHTTQAASILAVALAINIISFSIFTMAEGLLILSKLDFDSDKVKMLIVGVGVAFIAILGLILLISKLSGAGNTVNKVTNIMFGNTSPIHKFLTGLAALLLSISISIWLVVDAINRIMDAADRFNSDDNMVNKITEMFKGIATAFADSWEYIAGAVDHAGIGNDLDRWFASFLEHLVSGITNLLDAALVVIARAAEFLADALIEIMNGLAGKDLTTWHEVLSGGNMEDIFSEFINTAEGAPINRLINAAVAFIALFIYGVGDAIINNAGPLTNAIAYLVVALGTLIYYTIGLFAQAFSPELDMDTLNKYFLDFGQNFVDGWETTWTTVIKPGLTKLYDGIASTLRLGILGIAYSIAYGAEWVINEIFIKPLNELISSLPGLSDYTAYEYVDFTSGIASMMDTISGKSDEAANAIDNAASGLENFNSKMDELAGKNVNSTVTLNPMFATNSDQLNQDLFTAGDNAGKESVKGFNKAWDIHSPSVVGEQSGNDIGAGVVNGISGYFNSPEAQEKLSGIKDSLPKIDWSGLYDSDTAQFDLNPSQVFNLDTENMGDNLMESGFGDTFSGMSLNMGEVSTDLADVNSDTQEMSDALANEGGKFYDDTDVVNELAGLRTDIASLSRAMTQIKMYLDSNKLVGELVGPLDNALAQRASRAQRGN